MEVDWAARALGELAPGPAAIFGSDEAEIAAARRMAARVEDRRVGGMRRKAHEILDRRQLRREAVRLDGIEAMVRGEIEARRIGGSTAIPWKWVALASASTVVLASECERVARKAPAAMMTTARGTP
jgi:hypothetical protein